MKKSVILFILFFSFSFNLKGDFTDIPSLPDTISRGGIILNSVSPEIIYYNPAILPLFEYNNIEISYSRLFDIDALGYFSVIFIRPYVWRGTLGLGFLHNNTGGDTPLQNFEEERFYLSYGLEITSFFYTGISYKFFYLNYNGNKTDLFTFDLSTTLNINNIIKFSVIFSDIFSPSYVWYSGEEEKLNFFISSGILLKITDELFLSYNNRQNIEALGIEYKILKNFLDITCGIRKDKSISYTAGVNIKLKNLIIKYGIMSHYFLGYTHSYGINIRF